jgi:hypothetical protein
MLVQDVAVAIHESNLLQSTSVFIGANQYFTTRKTKDGARQTNETELHVRTHLQEGMAVAKSTSRDASNIRG